ncbi:MAG: hypothetical protein JSW21_07950 [Gammaproteobacteria bacterium]|nr:MAG: hypothetical protein JSW21_07950 [Gammaproteobacteria bacterium]
MIRISFVIIGLIAAPALLSAGSGSMTAVAADLSVLSLSCIREPGDEILDVICQRVEREAGSAALRAGYRLVLPAADPVGDGGRSLVIELTANSPESLFGNKRIQVVMTGRQAAESAAAWESRFNAEGVPRDLVHPVADAVLRKIEGFLASREEA